MDSLKCGSDFDRKSGNEVQAAEPDLLPEFCRYRDEGCEFASSCLSCPFPQCLYDEPRGRQRWLKGMRDKEIKRLHASGWKVSELAPLFGVSQRTIQRALKEEKGRADKQ